MIKFTAIDKYNIKDRGDVYVGYSKWELDKQDHPDWAECLFLGKKIELLYKKELLYKTIIGVEHYANMYLRLKHPIGFLVK